MEFPPLQALYRTCVMPFPALQCRNNENWSEEMLNLLNQCFQRRFDARPDAETLLKHSFLNKAGSAEMLLRHVKEVKRRRDN